MGVVRLERARLVKGGDRFDKFPLH
jgi:hypothetical protein